MDERYSTFQVNITGQLVTVETAKMFVLVTHIEQWTWKLKRWMKNRKSNGR